MTATRGSLLLLNGACVLQYYFARIVTLRAHDTRTPQV